MTKPHYADYVNHMIRYYVRTPEKRFRNEADEQNLKVVEKVLDNLRVRDRNLLVEVFKRNDTLSDNIYEVSKLEGVDQDILWTLLSKVTREVARERVLI